MTAVRVLVVEDEEGYRNLMASHLRRKGYLVETAEDGLEALEKLGQGPPFDVLVTDLMMPQMDGYELLRQAKAMEPAPEVVVISGAGTLESAISSMRQGGAFDYLPKPLDSMQDLSLAVARAAEHRRLRLEAEALHAQIAAERARLQAVMDNAGEAILAADAQGRITVANPVARDLFDGEDITGREASSVFPPLLRALLANWRYLEDSRPMVAEVPWPAGQVHMVSLTSLDVPDGEAGGWVMVLQPVTRLRRLDQLKMRGLAQAASRLRSPLAEAFATIVELNELPDLSGEDYTGSLERLIDRLSAVRAWTDNLLDLVRIQAEEEVELQPVDLKGVFEALRSETADGPVERKGLSLVWIDECGQPALADPQLVRWLLDKLIYQAAWRAPRESEIAVRLRQDLDQVWLQVEDTAPPVFHDTRPKAVEQLLVTPQDVFGDAGLEVVLALAIADRMGARLWAWQTGEARNALAASFALVA